LESESLSFAINFDFLETTSISTGSAAARLLFLPPPPALSGMYFKEAPIYPRMESSVAPLNTLYTASRRKRGNGLL